MHKTKELYENIILQTYHEMKRCIRKPNNIIKSGRSNTARIHLIKEGITFSLEGLLNEVQEPVWYSDRVMLSGDLGLNLC